MKVVFVLWQNNYRIPSVDGSSSEETLYICSRCAWDQLRTWVVM